MQYRRFGRTELQMPVFSCGGMRYQHSWKDVPLEHIPQKNQENLNSTIHRALAVGINHIETARGYGTSEIQLGQILPALDRDRIIVQTKVSPTADPAEFRQHLTQSLANLKLDTVDLLGIHGINTAELLDWTLRPGGCMEVAREFQRQGRVRFIGFSTHAPTAIIRQAIASDQFDYVNLHWYYINQDNWPAIDLAQRHDLGVFIISPSDKGGHLYTPPAKLVELCEPLSPMVFNDLFCLSHPQVHTLSVGAAQPTDFDEHLKVLPLLTDSDRHLTPALDRLHHHAQTVLGEDWLHTWALGLPDPDETPGNINIPAILRLRNLLLAFEMEDYAKARYNMLGNAGHWFPGEKAENLDQVDLSDCLRRSPYAEQIPHLLAEAHEKLAGQAMARLSNA
ncbi:aldo/keto reductase [Nodosilinea sp. LEGE 07088]|uniref:aldo/keto reductase n=1 Tax=Nodosilinea sp. LEGE 07088 TaxID=2777968 RepID=UPI00188293B8|nr:aldo/keto reductase [Nodosilinea sp. LEGE 07088]MBE9137901.1 aldo/keto reductase [Nodosilinea sp. LEGE 07088]